ncbi:hypothetical protein LCGC14_1546200, partial [marine sediment metagenome]
ESIEPITVADVPDKPLLLRTIGYQAHVQLWKDGVVVGGAIMPCYFTENCCKGKEGDAKHKACMSAAQTFATSKAYRMNFSYVAILAGFQPLPAEEVTDDMREPVDKTQHWCLEHDTAFFKKGKMTSYAHPIGDSKDWCHEHDNKKKETVEDQNWPEDPPRAKAAAEAAREALAEREPEEKSIMNLEWLKEQLGILQGKRIKAYSDTTILNYLNAITRQESKDIAEAASKLDAKQATEFTRKVREAVEMA